MNKSELINAIAQKANLSKNDAKIALDATIEAVKETLGNGDKLSLVGFGTFAVSERAARTGKNPRTGESIEIPAKKTVKFKAGSELEAAL